MLQRSCFFDNKMYYSGETFARGCNDRCQCHDGRLKCKPLCPQRISALAPKVSPPATIPRRPSPFRGQRLTCLSSLSEL